CEDNKISEKTKNAVGSYPTAFFRTHTLRGMTAWRAMMNVGPGVAAARSFAFGQAFRIVINSSPVIVSFS
ncbi:MAG: hypothetical protein LUC20_03255, partial [Oscillospiraceae bacterium]|nr:hypothetical protein [Oscillospiraceae bacterium]